MLAHKHLQAWLGHITFASVSVAIAVLAWILLKNWARILTDWQVGRW